MARVEHEACARQVAEQRAEVVAAAGKVDLRKSIVPAEPPQHARPVLHGLAAIAARKQAPQDVVESTGDAAEAGETLHIQCDVFPAGAVEKCRSNWWRSWAGRGRRRAVGSPVLGSCCVRARLWTELKAACRPSRPWRLKNRTQPLLCAASARRTAKHDFSHRAPPELRNSRALTRPQPPFRPVRGDTLRYRAHRVHDVAPACATSDAGGASQAASRLNSPRPPSGERVPEPTVSTTSTTTPGLRSTRPTRQPAWPPLGHDEMFRPQYLIQLKQRLLERRGFQVEPRLH